MRRNKSVYFLYIKHIVILFTLSNIVACASTESGEIDPATRRSDCIYQPSIRGYTVLDESNLIVSTSGRRKYHVALQRRAPGLRSTWAIAFKSPTGRICSAFSEVIFEGHFDGERIPISSIKELDPDAEEDLLIRYGKKKPEIEQTAVPPEIRGADVEELDPGAADKSSGD